MDRQSFEALLSAGEFEAPERPTALDTITATDLQKKDLPPIRFIVDRLLSVGLNILASPPKYGKSWMVLALCLAVASGDRFLGYTTNQCGCLYLALEDSQRRLKTRMNKLLAGKTAPAGFHFATTASPIDGGLFDELEDFLKKHPDTGLIVVDTLQRVRGASHGKEGGLCRRLSGSRGAESFCGSAQCGPAACPPPPQDEGRRRPFQHDFRYKRYHGCR